MNVLLLNKEFILGLARLTRTTIWKAHWLKDKARKWIQFLHDTEVIDMASLQYYQKCHTSLQTLTSHAFLNPCVCTLVIKPGVILTKKGEMDALIKYLDYD